MRHILIRIATIGIAFAAAIFLPVIAAKQPSVHYSWQDQQAEVTSSGDLVWFPTPFVFHADPQAKYIDYAAGNDNNAGTPASPWQHHPWDANAIGNAAACAGVSTFVFKGGVVYVGALLAKASGKQDEPIRLTRDPSWGTGDAIISGALPITGGWKPCNAATALGIPSPEKCWYQDIGTSFVPRALWAEDRRGIVRIPIARSPHWQTTDPNDPRTGWNEWTDVPSLPTGEMKDGKPVKQTWAVDTNHLTSPDPSYYVGATLWTEYVSVMGTPYAQIISKYDPAKHAVAITDCWDNPQAIANYSPIIYCRYYFENKPQFLDTPGEYYFDEKGPHPGRLYLRLPDDADPNTVTIEAARALNLIDIRGQNHIEISGLTFRYENVWPWGERWYKDLDVAPACVRILGSCADIRVANCKFDHVAEAVRTTATSPSDVIDDIEVCDNDITGTDHGGITTTSKRSNGIFPLHVRILRNRMTDIGARPIRSEHSVAIEAGAERLLEVAGNIIDRAYGTGIMPWGGWGDDKGPGDVPYMRMFIHHNKITNCLLHTSDWGGIDMWRAGGFVYDNIVGNPVGQWHWARRLEEAKRLKDPKTPYVNNNFCSAFYLNGPGTTNYHLFNNVAWGRSNDPVDPTANLAAYSCYQGALVSVSNNTFYRFEKGTYHEGLLFRSPEYYLGNLEVDIKTFPKSATTPADAVDPLPNPVDGPTVSRNVLIDKAPAFLDAGKYDFRLRADSPAVASGVKYFLPWPLANVVGQWRFHRFTAEPTKIRDEHFLMNNEWNVWWRDDSVVRHDLVWNGKGSMNFAPSPLEDWGATALVLDGKNGYCSISQQELQQDVKDAKTGKVVLDGASRRTPDMGRNNFLVEAYLCTTPNHSGGTIVSKGNGYWLEFDRTGLLNMSLHGGDHESSRVATAAVNDGKWHHIIAEVDRADANGIHLYVDGKLCDGQLTGSMPKASLSNTNDLEVGKDFSGAIAFLRISQGTLRDSDTSIEELYAWEFNGPNQRDFLGVMPMGKRDAGAIQHIDQLAWKAGAVGSPNFWHLWPDRLSNGPLHFTAREVESTPQGFSFQAFNVFADCRYAATRVSAKPNNFKVGNLDASNKMLGATAFPMDKLPKMTLPGQQFHIQADISDIKEDGSAFTAVFNFAGEDVTCKVERTDYKITKSPVPDIRDMRYGPHWRQTIDFYQAKSANPTPLVVSIHGGGWGALDKSALQIDVNRLLAQGISVAAINYRYNGMEAEDKLDPPVAAPLHDAARAIQFLRYKAQDLHINKERIAATGGSAGGCSSLWLAFHDDLANPNSPDPVARESTRLYCVGGTAAQTALDPKQMAEWMPGITYGPFAFGVSGHGKTGEETFQEFIDRRDEWLAKGFIRDLSPWSLVSPDDPPTYLEYPGSPIDPKPDDTGWQTHSPRWGYQLKKRMDELGVECHFTCAGIKDAKYPSMVDFFVNTLK